MPKSDSSGKRPFPKANPDTKNGMKLYWAVQEKYEKELNDLLMVEVLKIADFAPLVKAMTPETQAKQQAESRERSRRAFLHDEWDPYLLEMRKQGETYAKMGVGFAAWVQLLRIYKDIAMPYLVKELGKEQAKLVEATSGMHELLYIAIEVIGEAYLSAKESVIRNQEESIRELSTPVLCLRDRLLILPLIGIVDTQRARQVTEAMLRSIRDRRAKAVVMDITGVAMVDSKVANHLIQSVEAARLMGATVIITGLSPEIAQTLVALGAELPNVATFGDLQGGMEEAERLLGIQVIQRPKPDAHAADTAPGA
jgi:rsbT co-antagonist protein RsbR